MGLEHSRIVELPNDIDNKYEYYKINWTSENIATNRVNEIDKGKCTLGSKIISRAANHILNYLKSNKLDQIKILEPYAGNGVASNIIYKKLAEEFPNLIMKSTDIQNLSDYIDDSSYPVEFDLNSVDTIEKYSQDGFNILMMVSPPPGSGNRNYDYCDYFAIKSWSQIPSAELLIFVGELGASDGCEGLYDYLIENNPNWSLEFRKIIYSCIDSLGGPCEKEVFIFKKK